MTSRQLRSSLRVACAIAFATSVWVATAIPSAHAASGESSAADEAIVDAGLLTVDDVPPGWTESASSADSDSDSELSMARYGSDCARLQKTADKLKRDRTAHGESPDFAEDSNTEISNSVTTYPTAAQTKAALAFFLQSSIPRCLQKASQAELTARAKESPGLTFQVSFSRLSVPKAGDRSIGYAMKITAKTEGRTVHLVADYQLVLVGRAGMTFTFQGEGTSPMLDHQDVVRAAVARVEEAQRT